MRASDTDHPAAMFRKAVEQHRQGRFADALNSYDALIRLKPYAAMVHYNRGLVLHALSEFDDAIRSYDRAIALKPDHAEAHHHRGIALRKLTRPEDAVRSYDHAIRLKPDHAGAWYNRGNAFRDLTRPEDAVRSYDAAIKLKPDHVGAHANRGHALWDLGRPEEALRSFDQAIRLKPDHAGAHFGRANMLYELRRPGEALESYERAVELNPDAAEMHVGKGNALKELKRLDDAIDSYDRAIAIRPEFAEARWNKSVCQLLLGRFDEGWRLYEWRKKLPGRAGPRRHPQPEWTGTEGLEGKTLLVRAEQGLGDTIQFCRYARLAREKGANVILAVQEPLIGLLGGLDPAVEVVGMAAEVTGFDYQIALLSLPLALWTGRRNYRAAIPYLRAEPGRIGKWRDLFGKDGFRVGICWQGNKQERADIGRSFPLRHFERIAKIPRVRLISLQKGDGIEQLGDLPPGMRVETLGAFDTGPDAFVDTAAVMENLDLVISADTAVAHLAGALGRPTWIALKYIPDWRWLLDRSDSPWYPSAQLFRQTQRDDWSAVFAAMETELRKIASR
ncbi:MAG TPA: tetratricopeptide repeat-containing glycosyltransferase family protein [Rhizomicrobium sp.]|jgi:tetratricopeptide (TPR) repeat protein|nr:tetratricopeptide repeat-containing glycosyltransferase family protein [Rhizomicrobium sp.]